MGSLTVVAAKGKSHTSALSAILLFDFPIVLLA